MVCVAVLSLDRVGIPASLPRAEDVGKMDERRGIDHTVSAYRAGIRFESGDAAQGHDDGVPGT